jgi:outer membrane protein OmpA-like peptidoglycan-associated protein
MFVALLFGAQAFANPATPEDNASDSTFNSLLVDFLKARSYAPPALQCNDQEYPVFGVDIRVYNLGPQVNSKYSDYNPVLDKKESFMLFTSRRQVDPSEPKDIDNQYFEKMFVSRREDGVFGQARPITEDDSIFGRLPTSERHESLIFLSYSEDLLITYTNEKLYYSNRIGKFYTEPVEFPKVINKGKWKRHASITEDGRTLYFTTENVSKVSKNLNLDIWEIERKDDGSWKRPQRLNDVINSPYNEDSPEISPDGKFLFFSSNRAGGIGGYDVYMAAKVNDEWQQPRNLCQPINTPGDDIYFKLSRGGNYAYYSSNALGGQGNMDLYKVVLDVPSIATCGSYAFGRRNITFTSPFDIQFYGGGTEFFWAFGDGQTGVGSEVNHEYAADGDYNVVLYVRDRKSKRVINTVFSKKVRVDTENSTVEIMGPDTVELGDEILFDGSSSFVNNAPATAFYWKVDGQLVSREPVINYEFTGVGKHKIELEVGVLDERVMELSSSCIAREIDVVTPFVYKQKIGARSNSDGFSFTPLIPDRVLSELEVEEEPDVLNLSNDYIKTWEGEAKTFSAFENDRSPGVALDKIVVVSKAEYGDVKVINAAYGLIEYRPKPGFNGYDAFTYTARARDGRVATASVAISVMQRDEVMRNTNVTNDLVEVKDKKAVTIYPLQNDEHQLGANQRIIGVSQPDAGKVEQVGLDGLIKYEPNASFQGTDAFTYTVEDDNGQKNTASVVIKTQAVVKTDLFANPDYISITEDEKARLKVLENDVIKGGASIVSITPSKHGEAKILNPQTGLIFYASDKGFVGTDAFTYTLQNTKGERSTTSVTLVIEKAYDFSKPIAAETYQYNALNIFVFDELGSSTGLEFTSDPEAQNGKARIVDAKKGVLSYEPTADFTGYDLFFVDIKRGDENYKVGVVVKVLESSGLISKYGIANNTLSGNAEGKNALSPFFEYQKLGKDAQIVNVSSSSGDVSFNANNELVFDYSKLDKEQFAIAYQVKGDKGAFNASALIVNPVDEIGIPMVTRMVLTPDMAKTKVNEPVNVFPLMNDRHLKKKTFQLVRVAKPLNGTVVFKEADGSVLYIPNLDFNGTDAFTYTVRDADGIEATSAVNVVVLSEVQSKLENQGLNPKLKAFKYATLEADESFMSPEKVVDATNGLFGSVEVVNPNTGEIRYVPDEGFSGEDRFSFTMLHKDGNYTSHPVIAVVDDRSEFYEGTLKRKEVVKAYNDEILFYYPLINKQHPQGKQLKIVDVKSERGGITDIINETAFSYKSTGGDHGTDRITYRIVDENGKIQVNEVVIDLIKEEERVDLGEVNYKIPVNEPLQISLKEKASGYIYVDHSNPESGALQILSERHLSFEYRASVANRKDAFIVSLQSGKGDLSYLTVNVDILPEVDFKIDRARYRDFKLDLMPSKDAVLLGKAEPKKGALLFDDASSSFIYEPYNSVVGNDRIGFVVETDDSGPSTEYVNVHHLEFDQLKDGMNAYQGVTLPEQGSVLIYAFSNYKNKNAEGVVVDKVKGAKNGSVEVLDERLGIIRYTPDEGVDADEIEIYFEGPDKQKQTFTVGLKLNDSDKGGKLAKTQLTMSAAENLKAFNYELMEFLKKENLTMIGVSGGEGGEVDIFNMGDGIFSYLPKDAAKGLDYLLVEVEDASGMSFVVPVQVNVVDENQLSSENLVYENVASVEADQTSYHSVLKSGAERLTAAYGAKGGTVKILNAEKGVITYSPYAGFVGEDSYTFEYLNLDGDIIQRQMNVFVRDASAGLISMSEIKRQSESVAQKETNVTEVLAYATEQSQAEEAGDDIDYAAVQQAQQRVAALEAERKRKAQEEQTALAQAKAKEAARLEEERKRQAAELAALESEKRAKQEASEAALAEQQAAKDLADQAAKEKAEQAQLAEAQEAARKKEAERKRQEALAAQESKAKADAEAAQSDDDDVVVFRNILFDFDKSDLRPLSEEELNKVYKYLMNNPEKTLQLDGHADWIGTVEYNLALSERRAKRAYEYLKAKGVSDARMVYQYYGEAVPVAPNANTDGSDNPEGRQLNRRCEFNIKTEGTAEIIMKF